MFSFSGNTLSALRCRLSAEASTSSILLGSWSNHAELLAQGEFEDQLVQGWKRGKSKAKANEQAQEKDKGKGKEVIVIN